MDVIIQVIRSWIEKVKSKLSRTELNLRTRAYSLGSVSEKGFSGRKVEGRKEGRKKEVVFFFPSLSLSLFFFSFSFLFLFWREWHVLREWVWGVKGGWYLYRRQGKVKYK